MRQITDRDVKFPDAGALGGPPGADVKVSRGSVKVYAWLGPYYPPHARRAILRQPLEKVCVPFLANALEPDGAAGDLHTQGSGQCGECAGMRGSGGRWTDREKRYTNTGPLHAPRPVRCSGRRREVPMRPGKPPLEDEQAFGTPYEQVHQAAELKARKHARRSHMW